MEKFRIGFDITVTWAINQKDGSPYPLVDKDVRLYVTHPRGRQRVDFEIQDNVLIWHFLNRDQRYLGEYSLEVAILESEGKRAIRKDMINAFALVGNSCMECTDEGDANISEGGVLTLATTFDIYRIQPIVPKIVIAEDGKDYWEIDGVFTGKRASGKSAYDFAQEKGFEGSEEDFAYFQSLVANTSGDVEFLKNRLVVMSESEYESMSTKDDSIFYFTFEEE